MGPSGTDLYVGYLIKPYRRPVTVEDFTSKCAVAIGIAMETSATDATELYGEFPMDIEMNALLNMGKYGKASSCGRHVCATIVGKGLKPQLIDGLRNSTAKVAIKIGISRQCVVLKDTRKRPK